MSRLHHPCLTQYGWRCDNSHRGELYLMLHIVRCETTLDVHERENVWRNSTSTVYRGLMTAIAQWRVITTATGRVSQDLLIERKEASHICSGRVRTCGRGAQHAEQQNRSRGVIETTPTDCCTWYWWTGFVLQIMSKFFHTGVYLKTSLPFGTHDMQSHSFFHCWRFVKLRNASSVHWWDQRQLVNREELG